MLKLLSQDIRNITQDSLRACFGVVPQVFGGFRFRYPYLSQINQDCVLFNDSIYYNIAYGRLNATEEEVYEAAKF